MEKTTDARSNGMAKRGLAVILAILVALNGLNLGLGATKSYAQEDSDAAVAADDQNGTGEETADESGGAVAAADAAADGDNRVSLSRVVALVEDPDDEIDEAVEVSAEDGSVKGWDTVFYSIDYHSDQQGAVYVQADPGVTKGEAAFDSEALEAAGAQILHYDEDNILVFAFESTEGDGAVTVPLLVNNMKDGDVIAPSFRFSLEQDGFEHVETLVADEVRIAASAEDYDAAMQADGSGAFTLHLGWPVSDEKAGFRGMELPDLTQDIAFDITLAAKDADGEPATSDLALTGSALESQALEGGELALTPDEETPGLYHGILRGLTVKEQARKTAVTEGLFPLVDIMLQTNAAELQGAASVEATVSNVTWHSQQPNATGTLAEKEDRLANNTAAENMEAQDAPEAPAEEAAPAIAAAPLVELADSLDAGGNFPLVGASTLDYFVKDLAITRTYSGTGPWDDNTDPGNDSNDTNNIIRSFDSAIYSMTYSIGTRNDVDSVKGGSLTIRATLPVSSAIATWDLNMMSWLTDPVIVEEKGKQILTGTFTARNADIPLAPRIGALNMGINVGAAIQGDEIPTPTLEMWAGDERDPDPAEIATAVNYTFEKLTVSAKAQLDAQIKYEGVDSSKRTKWSVSLMLKASIVGKGLRGQELPDASQPLYVNLTTNHNQAYADHKQNNTLVSGSAAILQPADLGVLVPLDTGAADKETAYNKVYNGGVISLDSGVGTNIRIKLEGYEFDPNIAETYVTHNATGTLAYAGVYTRDSYNFASFMLLTAAPTGYKMAGDVAEANIASLTGFDIHGAALADTNSTNNRAAYSVCGYEPVSGGTGYGPMIMTYPYKEGGIVTTAGLSKTDSDRVATAGDKVFFGNLIYTENIINTTTYNGRKSFTVFTKLDGDAYEPIAGEDSSYGEVLYSNTGAVYQGAMVHEGDWTGSSTTRYYVGYGIKDYVSFKFVAKNDGSNWVNDDEMKNAHYTSATAGNYTLYNTAEEFLASGKKLVGFYVVISDVEKWEQYRNIVAGAMNVYYNTPLLRIKTSAVMNPVTNKAYANNDPKLVAMTTSDVSVRNGKGNDVFYNSASGVINPAVSVASGGSDSVYRQYEKAVYDANGQVVKPGAGNGSWYGTNVSTVNGVSKSAPTGGANFYIRSYGTSIEKKVSQTIAAGGGSKKETFNLDLGQRQVDYEIYNVGTSESSLDVHATDTLVIEDILPVGMHPYDQTATGASAADIQKKWNITYDGVFNQDPSTNGGAGGFVSGGADDPFATDQWQEVLDLVSGWYTETPSYTLEEIANVDGTTTLKWTFTQIPVGVSLPKIHYSTVIGTSDNVATDVANGTQLLNKVSIKSMQMNLTVSKEESITAVKVVGSTLLKSSPQPKRSNEDDPIGFDYQYTNDALISQGGIVEGPFVAIDVLPYNGDGRGSDDMGSYFLDDWKLSVRNLKAGTKFTLHYTTSGDVRGADLLPYTADGKAYTFDGTDGITWSHVEFADTDFDASGILSSAGQAKLAELKDKGTITAIGISSPGLQESSAFQMGFVYNWADAATKKAMQTHAKLYNSVEYGIDGVATNSKASTVPDVPVITGDTVTVHKSSDPVSGSKVETGDTITYSLEAVNTGASTVPFTVIRDYIPEGTTYVDGSASDGGVYVAAGNYVEWVVKDLDYRAGSNTRTVTFDVTVNADPPKFIYNVALFDQSDSDPGTPGTIADDPSKETNQTVHFTDEDEPAPGVLSAVKSSVPVSGTKVKAGETIVYSIEVSNNGAQAVNNVFVKDYVPVGTTFKTVGSANSGTYDAGGFVHWLIPSIDPGESVTVTFEVTVDGPDNGKTIRNQALFDKNWPTDGAGKPSSTGDPQNSTNIVEHPTPRGDQPIEGYQVTVNKSADPISGSVVKTGDTIIYTLAAKNTGAAIAPYTVVRDYIPEGTTYTNGSVSNVAGAAGAYVPATAYHDAYVEWVVTSLAPNEVRNLTFAVTVNADPPKYIHNEGLYDSGDDDPGNPGEIPDDPSKPTNPTEHTTDGDEPVPPLLDAVKSSVPAPGTEVKAGETIAYSIAVKNNGGEAANDVFVKDMIPVGTTFKSVGAANGGMYDTSGNYVYWLIPNIEPGATATVTFEVTVDGPDNGKIIRNQARYQKGWPTDDDKPTGTDGTPENSTNIVEHPTPIEPVQGYQVTVNKSANPVSGSTVEAGDEITYTLAAKNTGAVVAPFTVVRDYIPEGTTYKAGSVSNVAGSAGTYVPANADHRAYVEWVVAGLAPNETRNLTFTVTVVDDPPTYIYNVGLYDSGDDDPGNPGEIPDEPGKPTNPTEHTTETDEPVPPLLDAVKSSVPAPGTEVSAGETIAYSITVKNNGGETAKDVFVKDMVPAGTTFKSVPVANGGAHDVAGNYVYWLIPSIAKGASVTVAFEVTVDGPDNGKTVRNQARYERDWPTDGNGDPTRTDGTPENSTNIVEHPTPVPPTQGYQVTVNKGADPVSGSTVESGDEITYTLAAKNTGAATAPYTVVRDYIPEGTTYVAGSVSNVSGAAGTYVAAGNHVEWVVKDLAPNETRALTFQVTVDVNPPKYIYNVGLYDTSDDDPGNPGEIPDDPEKPTNPTEHTTDGDEPVPPLLDAVKSSEPVPGTEVSAGETIAYSITVKNNGGQEAKDVFVKDMVPKGTTFKSVGTGNGGSYDAIGKYVYWLIPSIAPGASVTVTFEVTVDGPDNGKVIRNQARYEQDWPTDGDGKPLDPGDTPESSTNVVEHPTPMDDSPKTADPVSGTAVEAGSEITYSVSYENATDEAATVTIVDPVPDYTSYVDGSANTVGGVAGTLVPAYSAPGKWYDGKDCVVWADVPVAADAAVTAEFTVKVDADAQGEMVENTAHITPSNKPEFDTNTTTHPVDPKTAAPATGTAVEAGSEITYTLTYKNITGEDATVDVTDATPRLTTFVSATGNPKTRPEPGETGAVIWEGIPVKAGESVSVTFTVKVDEDASGELINNVAHVDPSNRPAFDTNPVRHPVDPKTANPVSGKAVEAGSEIIYTLTYRNTTGEAADVEITDSTPAFTTFVAATGSPSSAPDAGGTGQVKWNFTNVADGATVQVTFTVKVNEDARGKLIDNVAHIAPSNMPAFDTNHTYHPVDPKAASPADGTAVEAGSLITYTLAYENTADEEVSVTITDATPASTTFVSVSGNPTVKPAVGANGSIKWENVKVAAKGSLTVAFVVKVDDDAKGTIVENTAHFNPANAPEYDSNTVYHPVDPKTANPASGTAVEAGSTIEYTLSYKNTTGEDAKVTFTDATPAFTTFLSATGSPTNAPTPGGTGTIEWRDVDVKAGAAVSVTFKVKVDADAQGEVIDNVAHIAPSNRPAYDTNHTVHPVDPKTANPASGTAVEAGSEITYTLAYKNTTGEDSTVTITDATPGTTTFVSATGDPDTVPAAGATGQIVWQDIPVSAGGSVSVTFTVKVDDDAQGVAVNNTAHINPENAPEFDTNTTVHPVDPKTADPASGTAVEAGSEITYTLAYKNTTGEDCTVDIADATPRYTTFVSATGNPSRTPQPGTVGIVEWKGLPVKAGETVRVTFTVHVNDDARGALVENIAHIMPSNAPEYDTNKTVHPVDPKTADPATGTAVEAGSEITYTLTYKNASDDPVTVTMTDAVPAATTFVSATGNPTTVPTVGERGTVEWKDVPVAGGATVFVTFTVRVDDDAQGALIDNVAHIAPSNRPAYDTNRTTHPVDPKTANPASGRVVEAGSEITYTLTYKNTSGENATVTIADATPAFTTFVAATGNPTTAPAAGTAGGVEWKDVPVAANETVSVTFTVRVNDDAQGKVVDNVAHITPSNAPSFETNHTYHPVDPKTANPVSGTAIEAGSEITYTLTYMNISGEDATVTITDATPRFTTYVSATGNPTVVPTRGATGSLEWADVPVRAGETIRVTFTVKVDADAKGALVDNVAHIAPSNAPAYDTNTTTHPVDPKTANPSTGTAVEAGSEITYTLTYKNTIGTDATVTIADATPAFTTFVSATGSPTVEPAAGATGDVVWADVPVAADGTVEVAFTVRVDDDAHGQTVDNVAHITPSNRPGYDTNPTSHPVDPENPIATKTANPASGTIVETSERITYRLTYQNVIGEAATVTIVDPIPANTVYAAASANTVNGVKGQFKAKYSAPGAWYDGRDCVIWENVPVASAESVTAEFRIKVLTSAVGKEIENTASMVPSNRPAFDTNTTKHPVPTERNPQGDPDIDENLQVVKAVDKTEAKPGDSITYTIVATNIGEDVLEGILIRDYIPEYTTFVNCDHDGFYGTVNGKNHVTWSVPILWPGEEIRLTFVVKINADTPENTTITNVALYGPGNNPEDPNDPSRPSNPVDTVTPSNPANPNNPSNPGTTKNTGTTSPKTGDETMLAVLVSAAAVALFVMLTTWARRRRSRQS